MCAEVEVLRCWGQRWSLLTLDSSLADCKMMVSSRQLSPSSLVDLIQKLTLLLILFVLVTRGSQWSDGPNDRMTMAHTSRLALVARRPCESALPPSSRCGVVAHHLSVRPWRCSILLAHAPARTNAAWRWPGRHQSHRYRGRMAFVLVLPASAEVTLMMQRTAAHQ